MLQLVYCIVEKSAAVYAEAEKVFGDIWQNLKNVDGCLHRTISLKDYKQFKDDYVALLELMHRESEVEDLREKFEVSNWQLSFYDTICDRWIIIC